MKVLDSIEAKFGDADTTKRFELAMKEMAKSGKLTKVAAVLDTLPLPKHIEEHFKSHVAYLWTMEPRVCKEIPAWDGKYFGVWVTNDTPHIQLVVATKTVLEYILRLKPMGGEEKG